MATASSLLKDDAASVHIDNLVPLCEQALDAAESWRSPCAPPCPT